MRENDFAEEATTFAIVSLCNAWACASEQGNVISLVSVFCISSELGN